MTLLRALKQRRRPSSFATRAASHAIASPVNEAQWYIEDGQFKDYTGAVMNGPGINVGRSEPLTEEFVEKMVEMGVKWVRMPYRHGKPHASYPDPPDADAIIDSRAEGVPGSAAANPVSPQGRVLLSYHESYKTKVQWWRTRGVYVILNLDSDCMQYGRQDDRRITYCELNGIGGAWNSNAVAFQEQNEALVWILTDLKDMIAAYEPLTEPFPEGSVPVEPQGLANNSDPTSPNYWGSDRAIREMYRTRSALVAAVPGLETLPAIIGPNAYQQNQPRIDAILTPEMMAESPNRYGMTINSFLRTELGFTNQQMLDDLEDRTDRLVAKVAELGAPGLLNSWGFEDPIDTPDKFLLKGCLQIHAATGLPSARWEIQGPSFDVGDGVYYFDTGTDEWVLRQAMFDVMKAYYLVWPDVPSFVETTFNSLYTGGFVLPQPTGSRTYTLQSAPAKTSDLSTPGYTDNQTGAKIFRLTTKTEGGTARNRHEYSRRSPWSRDNKRYITQTLNGFWWLYDADTHALLTRGGTGGSIPGLAGDCEPIWSPIPGEERILWHTAINGGLTWTSRNVDTGATTTLIDFATIIPAEITAGRLPSSFSDVTRTWFKGEGRPSNDGRYWCLKCDTTGFTQRGVMMFDRQLGQVVGYVETSNAPDHVCTSPLGTRMLLSYYDSSLGVRSFARTYQGSTVTAGVKLTHGVVEHGDTALGPLGEEYYVQADFASGSATEGDIRISDCTTGTSFKVAADLGRLYAASGESVSIHISGICSEKRPGWVCVSTYASYQGGNPANSPATAARIQYETIFMLELKTGGKRHLVCETHQQISVVVADDAYFTEPHAATNFDGTRIAFVSGYIGRSGTNTVYPDSFAAYLPSTAY